MSFLYPLMYLELMCVIGTHPAFKIYIREHLIFFDILMGVVVVGVIALSLSLRLSCGT